MKRLIKNILWTMFFMVFCPIYLVFESLKYILLGKNIGGRLAIIVSYMGIVLLALFKPIVFGVVIGIVVACDLIAAILMTKGGTGKTSESSKNENEEYHSSQGCKIPFFDGMTVEEAKKEYRKLMKQYHPDNINGDAEMSKRVSAAYSQFCAAYGR